MNKIHLKINLHMDKMIRYLKEISFALRSGVSTRDKLFLSIQTLASHMHNLFYHSPHETRPVSYRLNIENKVLNVKLRENSGDLLIFYEIMLDKSYRLPETFQKKRQELKIIDVGANIGLATLYYDIIFPGSSFFCVEPDTNNFQVLTHNISKISNAKAVRVAAAAQTGKRFFDSSGYSWRKKLSDAGQEVVAWKLDEIILKSGFDQVDILKIDIEGAEREIFASKEICLEKVNLIIIELHGNYSEEQFREDVRWHGFDVIPAGSTMTLAIRKKN